MVKIENIEYCRDIVRQADKDRFWLSLVCAKSAAQRHALWALFAFNHEIEKTRSVVTETTMGLMRLQWWRDIFKAYYEDGQKPQGQIPEALIDVIQEFHLPRDKFDELLYAREFDLEDVLPSSKEGLLNYCDFTMTPLTQLALQICGEKAEAGKVKAVSQGYALTALLLQMPVWLRHRRSFFPSDMLARHDIREGEVYNPQHYERLKPLIQEVCDWAGENVASILVESQYLKTKRSIFSRHLKVLRRLDYDVFDSRANLRTPWFYLKTYGFFNR